MHNCKETRERITELALDGADVRAEEVATALGHCDECRAEFAALSATLRATARLGEAAAPAENYWPGYHELLRNRLQNAGEEPPVKAQRRKDELGPLFASSFAPLRLCASIFLRPVSVPLGAAALVVCSLLAAFAFAATRRPPVQVQFQAQAPVVVHVPVQVPVVREKVVAKVVYRERRAKRTVNGPTTESTFARSQKPRNESLPINLTGFKPNDEIKLTVIKGGQPNEK